MRITTDPAHKILATMPGWKLLPAVNHDIFLDLAEEDRRTAEAILQIPAVQRILGRLMHSLSLVSSAAIMAAAEANRLEIERQLMGNLVTQLCGKDARTLFAPPRDSSAPAPALGPSTPSGDPPTKS